MVKNFDLGKRIDNLSKKINDPNPEEIIHIDFESFSDAERILFQKAAEIEEEWQKTGKEEILLKNAELLLKPSEIIFRRITELYCYVATTLLAGGQNKEIVDYFFKLHFYNFEADLSECLAHVRTRSEEDNEEFLSDLKQNGAFFFRLPRCYSDKEVSDLINSKDLGKREEKEEK